MFYNLQLNDYYELGKYLVMLPTTGGSGGIGFACAAIFAKFGARVALFDQDKEALEETRSLISRASTREVSEN